MCFGLCWLRREHPEELVGDEAVRTGSMVLGSHGTGGDPPICESQIFCTLYPYGRMGPWGNFSDDDECSMLVALVEGKDGRKEVNPVWWGGMKCGWYSAYAVRSTP